MIEIRTAFTTIPYKLINYPDGTQKIDFENDFRSYAGVEDLFLVWKGYRGDEELVTLIYLTRHIQNEWHLNPGLYLPYVPNARMDRVKDEVYEVFTLKYFTEIINSLNFKFVQVLDPHSNVTSALLDKVKSVSPYGFISNAIDHIKNVKGANKVFLYFPDEGAEKRYSELFRESDYLVGHKKRNWRTGEIEGLTITGKNGQNYTIPEDASVLMVDDIISYGGTLSHSAYVLKEMGFSHIYAYATHVEDSVLDKDKGTLWKDVENGLVDMIFTTDSLFSKKNYLINVSKCS